MSESAIVRFARDVLSFRLFPKQADIVNAIYGDDVRVAILRLGRRSGKGRIAALVATFEATVNAANHLRAVPPGEQVAIVVVATSQRQARVVHRYIRGFLKSPLLAPMVVRETLDTIELDNGMTILTLPADAAAARGLAVAVVIMDEVAWFQGVDGSAYDVSEVWRALVPATATFPQSRVIVMSTPRWATGWYPDIVAQAESGLYPDMRHWHATTRDMNPRVPQSFLDAEQAKDPENFRREYLAEFVDGIGSVFDADLVRAAVRERGDLPAIPETRYTIALDPAFTGDRFTLLVGHRDDERTIVDRIRAWEGSKANPVNLDTTLDEVALIAMAYNRAPVVIDQFAAEPIRQGLEKRGVRVEAKPWTNESKVDAVASVRKALYSGNLDLPKHRELVAELVSLEQRPTPSGRPRIAAPGRAHDDFATAAMALVAALDVSVEVGTGATIEAAPGAYDRHRPADGFGRMASLFPSSRHRRITARVH